MAIFCSKREGFRSSITRICDRPQIPILLVGKQNGRVFLAGGIPPRFAAANNYSRDGENPKYGIFGRLREGAAIYSLRRRGDISTLQISAVGGCYSLRPACLNFRKIAEI